MASKPAARRHRCGSPAQPGGGLHVSVHNRQPSRPAPDPVTRTLLTHFGDAQESERRRAAAQRIATLTDREREVDAAIVSGASIAEVAASLYKSEATVKAHVSHLCTKLDVTSRVQIAIVAYDAGLS